MIEGSRRLSQRHITIRVPWHDAGWGGTVCKSPSANTSCLVLARIASGVRPDRDEFAGRAFDSLEITELPPCIEERGGFMSPHDITLKKTHPYKHSSPDTHGHFGLTPLRLEAYSAACIPFGWMLRRQVEGDQRSGDAGKAQSLKLGYDFGQRTRPSIRNELDTGSEQSACHAGHILWRASPRDLPLLLLRQTDTPFGKLSPRHRRCRTGQGRRHVNRLSWSPETGQVAKRETRP